MANKHLLILVIVSLINSSIQDATDNKIDSQEESPLSDVAKEILKEKNLENIGGMVNSFMQSGGAKQVMDGVLQNLASNGNSGQLLESLGSILNSVGGSGGAKKGNDEINPMELLSGLGSIVGAMQGAAGGNDQGNPAAMLQGLGSLLGGGNNGDGGNNAMNLLQTLGPMLAAAATAGNQGGGDGPGSLLQGLGSLLGGGQEGEQGGLNPELIGNMINMFANSQGDQNPKPSQPKPSIKAINGKKTTGKAQNQEEGFDFSNIVNLASGFLNNKAGGGSGLMDYLPLIMNTISSFTDQASQERADSHSEHSWGLPPVIEKLHIYFDHFMNSKSGKKLLTYIREQKVYKAFQDEQGNFSYDKFKQLIENHSFRRHWIKRLTNKLVKFLKLVSDENIQREYVDNGLFLANMLLTESGFPNKALLDMKRPSKSITNFANFVAQKYLETDIDVKDYVEPAVEYTQQLLESAKSISRGPELADQMADAINMEIIEPITRVNRAYRFAKTQPNCDRYVLCIINQDTSASYDPGSLPKIRMSLYRGYSLIAAWFLTSHTGTSYWDLYDVVAGNRNCKAFYDDSCSGFYHEEIKATTEYVHNEL